MFLIAIITAALSAALTSSHAPAVNLTAHNAPTASHPAPAKPLTQGLPLTLPRAPAALCNQYNVQAALYQKHDATALLQSPSAACPPGNPPHTR